jgi:hypothetical protein
LIFVRIQTNRAKLKNMLNKFSSAHIGKEFCRNDTQWYTMVHNKYQSFADADKRLFDIDCSLGCINTIHNSLAFQVRYIIQL